MERSLRTRACVRVYPCHSGDCKGDGLADSLGDHICKLVQPESTLLRPLSSQWGKQEEITCTLHIHRTSNHDLSTTHFYNTQRNGNSDLEKLSRVTA